MRTLSKFGIEENIYNNKKELTVWDTSEATAPTYIISYGVSDR